jgi:imidazolonepropionase-like amidohydrolase
MLPQPATPAAAAAAVRTQSSYAEVVKLFVGSWVTRDKVLPMPLPIATAAAREAHRAGKLVFAHPSNVAGLDVALGARVDVLAHALDDTRGLTNAHFAQMRRQNMGMIPTLTLFKGDPDIVAEVGTYFKLGGQILFGTDVGFLSDVNPTPEYELMTRAGLRWQDILASLTSNPSSRFRESRQRGRVQPGMDGDVVVLGSDPAVDVRAFGNVRHTIRRGRLIFSSP